MGRPLQTNKIEKINLMPLLGGPSQHIFRKKLEVPSGILQSSTIADETSAVPFRLPSIILCHSLPSKNWEILSGVQQLTDSFIHSFFQNDQGVSLTTFHPDHYLLGSAGPRLCTIFQACSLFKIIITGQSDRRNGWDFYFFLNRS